MDAWDEDVDDVVEFHNLIEFVRTVDLDTVASRAGSICNRGLTACAKAPLARTHRLDTSCL